MQIDKKNFFSAVVIGLVFIGIIIIVQSYPMAAKRLPLAVSVLGVILSIIVALRALRPEKEKKEKGPEAALAEAAGKEVSSVALTRSLAWIGGILFFVYLLGLQFGLSFYAFLYCRLHGGKWLESIALGLGVMLFIYLIFIVLLKSLFPPGLLFKIFA